MPSELLPSDQRSTGIALLNFTNGMTTFCAIQIFPLLIEVGGVVLPFAIFGTMSLLSAVLLSKYVPETRGRSLEDIEQHYRIQSGSETKLFFARLIQQMIGIISLPRGEYRKKSGLRKKSGIYKVNL